MCVPSPLAIQTDWFPEAEHGALYHLVGDDYSVDTDKKSVRGSMVLDGTDLGVDFEVRTGGPAIGYAPVSSHMYTDNSLHLGYASTDAQILQFGDAPMVSVVAPLEKNPQMIMWDPQTYPGVESIADLGREGVTVNVFGGGTFSEVFVAQGIWSADQVDPSYDGSPARFVSAGGSIAQQGFASAEPFQYEHTFEEWGRPVAFELLHDSGFQVYSQTVGVRAGEIEEMAPCLELLVPIIQQAVVSYDASPGRANAIIVDAVEKFADFWTYSPELAEFSVQAQRDYGLIGNGGDSIVGNMQADRIQGVLDAILATDLSAGVADNITAEDIFTNRFIDNNIGFAETMMDSVAADLSGVCPSPLAIQTDWFPEAEHGALYHLVGDDYSVDTDKKSVRGSMVLDGTDLGVDFEVRTGGPAIGYAPVSSHMYTDNSLHLGYASTDAQILQFGDAPMVSVVAPLEKNPQMIMWDPQTYPGVESIADLGREGVTVNVFGGGTFSEVFVAQGIWSADQVDPSYDGSPARFVSAGGSIAQQGFASAEPFQYEHTFEEWGRPVAFELLHDSGFQVYSQTVGVRAGEIEEMAPCLELLVPIIQQAVVSYDASPGRANAIIVDAVEKFADFWTYSPELAEFSVQAQRDYGLIGNGGDSIVGNMQADRIQGVLDAILATDLSAGVADNITAEDIFTNRFIDNNIGF